MSPLVTIELKLCKECMQMKNHLKEIYDFPVKRIVWTCQKCNNQVVEK